MPTIARESQPTTALLPTSARVWRSFSSRPERVYDAFLDPDMIRAWFGPGLGEILRVDVEPHVGGRFAVRQRRGEIELETRGGFRELDRPHRLVLTWATPAAQFPEGVVTIELESRDGGSAITLTHQLDPSWAGRTAEIETGWTHMLDALADALGYPASDNPSINAPGA